MTVSFWIDFTLLGIGVIIGIIGALFVWAVYQERKQEREENEPWVKAWRRMYGEDE